MVENLPLPASVYHELQNLAAAEGTTPAEWVAEQVALKRRRPRRPLTPEEREEDNARIRQFMVSTGYGAGSDNEGIDADLAREYGDDHEPTRGTGSEK